MLVLAARHEERVVHSTLIAGADEVIACPDRLLHVLMRLRGLLLRAERDAKRDLLTAGRLAVHRKLRYACLDDCRLELTVTELVIVEQLVLHAGRVVSIPELMSALGRTVSDRTIREHIRHIRDKMNPSDPDDSPIGNKHGYGYYLDATWEPKHAGERGDEREDGVEKASGVTKVAPVAEPLSVGAQSSGFRRRA